MAALSPEEVSPLGSKVVAAIIRLSVKPVSALCVKVTSWSLPKLTTEPSPRKRSDHSSAAEPSAYVLAAAGVIAGRFVATVASAIFFSTPPSLIKN